MTRSCGSSTIFSLPLASQFKSYKDLRAKENAWKEVVSKVSSRSVTIFSCFIAITKSLRDDCTVDLQTSGFTRK